MELRHIPLEQLHISPLDMRFGKKAPDVSDILPSVRERGILQPLLVRPNADGFEVVAGRRRYFSAKAVEKEKGSFDSLPCAVLDVGDDAAVLEASLIENTARLDPDPITQFESFAKLVLEGRTVEQIALTFGLTKRAVEQRLALGNLHPKIRQAAKAEQTDIETLRLLTMATQQKQKEWLGLYAKKDAPYGYRLKQWLFGGESISVKVALFPLEEFKGEIVSDLFGDERYFVEAPEFWAAQEDALAKRRDALLKSKWPEVIVLERGAYFDQWAHEKVAKKDGGKVFVTVSHRGEVEFFYGWLPRKEIKKKSGAKAAKKNEDRPQMTQAMENYLELHRHAAVRLALLADPAKAFRLLVAHAIASSGNWSVFDEAQRSHSNAIKASIEGSAAHRQFEKEARKAYDFLDLPETVTGDERTALCFVKLLGMKDAQVMRLAAITMVDTLAVGSIATETAGAVLEVDARSHWQADDCFFDMIRDRATLNAMVAEVAGKDVAKANAQAKTATLRQIIRDALAERNGRKKAEGWLPGWMAFPFVPYGKGASGLAEASATAKKLLRKL
jgi:ParB family transcriptional regulator, chromosome partitioning protein